MGIRSSSGFSHLWPGLFHISLRTHKTQHPYPRGWKKRRRNNHGLGSAPRERTEKSVALSLHSVRYRERGVMVIVTGYGHGDTSSIPVQD